MAEKRKKELANYDDPKICEYYVHNLISKNMDELPELSQKVVESCTDELFNSLNSPEEKKATKKFLDEYINAVSPLNTVRNMHIIGLLPKHKQKIQELLETLTGDTLLKETLLRNINRRIIEYVLNEEGRIPQVDGFFEFWRKRANDFAINPQDLRDALVDEIMHLPVLNYEEYEDDDEESELSSNSAESIRINHYLLAYMKLRMSEKDRRNYTLISVNRVVEYNGCSMIHLTAKKNHTQDNSMYDMLFDTNSNALYKVLADRSESKHRTLTIKKIDSLHIHKSEHNKLSQAQQKKGIDPSTYNETDHHSDSFYGIVSTVECEKPLLFEDSEIIRTINEKSIEPKQFLLDGQILHVLTIDKDITQHKCYYKDNKNNRKEIKLYKEKATGKVMRIVSIESINGDKVTCISKKNRFSPKTKSTFYVSEFLR